MDFEWLIPLVSAVIACLGLFYSKPDRPRVAVIAAVLIFGLGAWESSKKFTEMGAQRATKARVHRNLIGKTDGLLNFISYMIFRASDGWLPKNEAEFFSDRTATMLCRNLDISRPAPVIPAQLWRARIAEVFSDFRQSLRLILDQNATVIESTLAVTADRVAESYLLEIGIMSLAQRRSDAELNVHRPPLLCWGLEPLVADSLKSIYEFHRGLQPLRGSAGVSAMEQWLVFPLPQQKHLMGLDRFSEIDRDGWFKRYPDAPGPATFSRGDPNKGQRSNKDK